MRKNEAKGVTVDVQRKGARTTVTVDAIDASGRFLNQAQTEMTVIDPLFGNQKLALSQTAPGRYIGQFDTPHPGAYHLDLTQSQSGRALYHQTRGLVVGYADELRLRPTNEELLTTVARVSGGVFSPQPEQIFAETDQVAARATPLWPYLVLMATVLLVFDVALRRIDFSIPWEKLTRRLAH
jgi:hypothetical protein